jgi:hypothetical protein
MRYWQQQATGAQSIARFTIAQLTVTDHHRPGSGLASVDVRYGSGSQQAMPLSLIECGRRWYACPPRT